MQKTRVSLIVILLTLFLFIASPVHAFSFDDVVKNVQQIFKPQVKVAPPVLSIDAKISLVDDGDMNKNGQIDAGDMVRFSYVITNTTDKEHSFAILKTNINRQQLNFIHNVVGTTSLDDNGETITFPNFHIGPNQITNISFDARINSETNLDPTISTEADFVSRDNKSITKSQKREIRAKRMNKDNISGEAEQQLRQVRQ